MHYIDDKLDKGFIIAQEIVSVYHFELQTLKSTYNELNDAAIRMFKKAFFYYDYWLEMRKQALGKGTYHTDSQGVELRKHITSFDAPISEFVSEFRK